MKRSLIKPHPKLNFCVLLALLIVLAACQPAETGNPAPTVNAIPTVTPGQSIRGALPTIPAQPVDSSSGLANPATAVALASRPTATPNYAACPPIASPQVPALPATGREILNTLEAYLNAGAEPATLETLLRDQWNILGENGLVRTDIDLTGENTPEVLALVTLPDVGETLVILGCVNGRYTLQYQAATGTSSQIIHMEDMNFDTRREILYTGLQCGEENTACTYRTQLVSWQPELGRFLHMLANPITSQNMPLVNDTDSDRVTEIVVRLTDTGNAQTGPQRTGLTIYDWNGVNYTLSITQLDPPQFTIQVIRQADLNMSRAEYENAAILYRLALTDNGLRNWYNDDEAVLDSYAFFRLLTIYAFIEDAELVPTYQTILQKYPQPENAPVYALMSITFWNALQVSNNLRSACGEVQSIIEARPEALTLINRYGGRQPAQTASTLCPF